MRLREMGSGLEYRVLMFEREAGCRKRQKSMDDYLEGVADSIFEA